MRLLRTPDLKNSEYTCQVPERVRNLLFIVLYIERLGALGPPVVYTLYEVCMSVGLCSVRYEMAASVWPYFFSFFLSSLLLSSSTRRRFYPQRSSGQAVVTGVVPSSPRHVPSIFIAHRVQHSHCSSISSNVANSRSRAFRYSIFMQEKVPSRMCTRWELNSRNWF